MNLKNVSVLVTGGASGLGEQTARELAKLGALVTVIDINEAAVHKVATEIAGLGIAADVSSEESIVNCLDQIIAAHGIPRVCINCAGIIVANRLVGKQGPMPLSDFQRCIQVNLIGTFNVMRLVAEKMQQLAVINSHNERGVIINTSSIAALEGQIGQVAYSASKGGVAAMTLPVARELAKFGIRVVAVAPGLLETPMLSNLPDAAKSALENSTVFPKRLGKPKEFADFIIHIIENPLLNGSLLRLDGAVRLSA